MTSAPGSFDAFLSHNSADKPLVKEIGRWLEDEAGLRVWLDEWNLIPGAPWQEGLEQALDDSKCCVVFLGSSGIGTWQNEEMRVALAERVSRGLKVVPVLLPGADRPRQESELPAFLRLLTWVTFGEDWKDEDALHLLRCGIQGLPPGRRNVDGRWNIPQATLHFTGREDVLEALHEALQGVGRAVLGQAAISGLGGIGKTQTALTYAHRYRDRYQHGFWVRADTKAEILVGYVAIARLLELPEADAQEQDLAVEAVRGWLTANDGWLLVFDNADRPEMLKPFLPSSQPSESPTRGRLLLTSRARHFVELEIHEPLRMQTLPPDEALTFLLRRTGRHSASRRGASSKEQAAAKELAEELGHLPLALEQAAAYIVAKEASFGDYLTSFRNRGARMVQPLDYPESVETTWWLNFREVEKASAAAADLLSACSFLAPDDIPLEFFEQGATKLGPALAEKLADAPENPLAIGEVLASLLRFSLIERDVEERTVSVHRMVQAVVREGLGKRARRPGRNGW